MTDLLKSSLCTEESLTSERFLVWADRMHQAWDPPGEKGRVNIHRKLWEWFYAAEALNERGLLRPGSRGVGFGVGQDPLAAVFASMGCDIVATDLDTESAARGGWVETGQHAHELSQLNEHGLCDADAFAERVTFRTVDMNRIPKDLTGFDFAWSSCAFEHLGSIALGQEFILSQMDCLRPGGVAVHTTEYNVRSNDDTIRAGQTVLFRQRDIDWLVGRLRAEGHHIEIDYDPGTTPADQHVDVPPWSDTHLKILVDGYVTTSLGLIITKGHGPGRTTSQAVERQVRHAVALHRPKVEAEWARGRTRAAQLTRRLVDRARSAAN